MASYEPLSPKPGGTGGYFWTIWADWGLVAKVGLGFVGAIALFASVQFYFEEDNQKDSFNTALATIAGLPLERPIAQRGARLLKRGDKYSWRAILWVRDGAAIKPKIWHAIVLHEGKSFRCTGSEVTEYHQEKAFALELFEDVSAGPPAPR